MSGQRTDIRAKNSKRNQNIWVKSGFGRSTPGFYCDTAPYIRKLLCAPQLDVRLSDTPVVFINSSWLRSLEISISHALVSVFWHQSECLPPGPPGTLGQSFTPITGVRPWVTHAAVRPRVTHCSAADPLGQNYTSRMIISTQFSRVGFKMLIKSRQNHALKKKTES